MTKPTDTVVEILGKVGLFQGLRSDQVALVALAHEMTLESHPAKHQLLVEGELGDKLFILLEGQVAVYRKTQEGEPYKLAILEASQSPSLGEGGLIEAEPRSATVVCEQNCRFLVLTREAFLRFTTKNPAWGVPVLLQVSAQTMKRLRQATLDVALLHKALMNEIRG